MKHDQEGIMEILIGIGVVVALVWGAVAGRRGSVSSRQLQPTAVPQPTPQPDPPRQPAPQRSATQSPDRAAPPTPPRPAVSSHDIANTIGGWMLGHEIAQGHHGFPGDPPPGGHLGSAPDLAFWGGIFDDDPDDPDF
jgi:hypothetical protein